MKLRHIGKTTFEMKSLFRGFGLIITTEKKKRKRIVPQNLAIIECNRTII